MKNVILIIAVVFVLSSYCLAQETYNPLENGIRAKLGVGVTVSESPYEQVGTKSSVIPIASIYCDKFFLEGLRFGYGIYEDENLTLAPILQLRLDGYEDDDSSFLKGMRDREETLDAGLMARYKTDFGVIGATVLFDTLSRHNGSEVKLDISRRYRGVFDVNELSIAPMFGVSFLDSDLADYYYGVRTSEASGARTAYNVDSSINYFAAFNASYKINEKWSAMLNFKYTWLDDEIYESSIVSESGIATVMMGAIYKF